MNQLFLELNACNIASWQLLLGLFLPFVLGYFFKRFLDEKYRTGYKELTIENDSLKQEVTKSMNYKTSLTGTEKELKSLHANYSTSEKRNESLRTDLEAALLKLKPFEGVNLTGLQSRISELEGVNRKLTADIDELTGTKSSLEDAAAGLNSLKSNFSTLQSENARLKMDLRLAIEAKEKTIASNEKIDKFKEEVREMSGKMGGFTVESERLKKETADAKAALQLANTEVAASKNELLSLTEKIKIISTDHDSLRTTNLAAEKELIEIRNKLNSLNADLATAKSDTESFKKAASSSTNDISGLTDKLRMANAELESFRSKTSGSENELNELRNKVGSVSNELDISKSRVLELEGKSTSSDNELRSLQDRHLELERSKATVQTALEECQAGKASINSLNEEISRLKSNVTSLEKEKNEMKLMAVAAPPPIANDDLKLVEGMGPKIEQVFHKAGIKTFRQLATTDYQKLKSILEAEGPRYQIHDPYTWPRQASLLADNKLDELKEYQDYLIAGVDPERLNATKASAEPAMRDSLIKIEGIGPKIQELCYNAGIYTFKQLSVTSAEKLKSILDAAGPRYQIHDPATWPAQSTLAAAGKWDELKVMQDSLKGGKTN
ncbi:MAG: helix-hairpin-helix domain-containing protein [Chitinophagaceae bacterium]